MSPSPAEPSSESPRGVTEERRSCFLSARTAGNRRGTGAGSDCSSASAPSEPSPVYSANKRFVKRVSYEVMKLVRKCYDRVTPAFNPWRGSSLWHKPVKKYKNSTIWFLMSRLIFKYYRVVFLPFHRHRYFVTSYRWESETELGRLVNEVSISYHNGSISPHHGLPWLFLDWKWN